MVQRDWDNELHENCHICNSPIYGDYGDDEPEIKDKAWLYYMQHEPTKPYDWL